MSRLDEDTPTVKTWPSRLLKGGESPRGPRSPSVAGESVRPRSPCGDACAADPQHHDGEHLKRQGGSSRFLPASDMRSSQTASLPIIPGMGDLDKSMNPSTRGDGRARQRQAGSQEGVPSHTNRMKPFNAIITTAVTTSGNDSIQAAAHPGLAVWRWLLQD